MNWRSWLVVVIGVAAYVFLLTMLVQDALEAAP